MCSKKYTGASVALARNIVHISDVTGRFALTENDGSTVRTRYPHGDHLGSCHLETDGSGAVISYEEYHPFGTTAYQATLNLLPFGAKRYRYCGKERDEESGLYYYGARYYASWLGRFVSVDPKESKYFFQSSYAYSENSPVTKMDWNGEGAIDDASKYYDDPSMVVYRLVPGLSSSGESQKTDLPAEASNKGNLNESEFRGTMVITQGQNGHPGTIKIYSGFLVVTGGLANNGFNPEQFKQLENIDDELNAQNLTVKDDIIVGTVNVKGYSVQFDFDMKPVGSVQEAKRLQGGGDGMRDVVVDTRGGQRKILTSVMPFIGQYHTKAFQDLFGVDKAAKRHNTTIRNMGGMTT